MTELTAFSSRGRKSHGRRKLSGSAAKGGNAVGENYALYPCFHCSGAGACDSIERWQRAEAGCGDKPVVLRLACQGRGRQESGRSASANDAFETALAVDPQIGRAHV